MSRAKLIASVTFALALAACTQTPPPNCPRNFQSPRRIWPVDQHSTTSIVEPGPDGSIYYTPREGGLERQQLFICGQHYHCSIENYQQCLGNLPPPTGKATCRGPVAGDWIEIHTVYAKTVRPSGCNRETLECCDAEPYVVRAYQARLTDGGDANETLPDPWTLPVVEWSGSSTGPDTTTNECKVAAAWRFTPGCGLQISVGLIARLFQRPDPPRALQSPNRLSRDLTLVSSP